MEITWHAIMYKVLQKKIKQGREMRGACHNRGARGSVELRVIKKFHVQKL